MLAAATIVAGLSGCAQVREISYEPATGSGVVAIPANAGIWEGYNRRAAEALIRNRVGPHFDIVDEQRVATGQQIVNNQQVNGSQSINQTTTQPIEEWRIAYRKKAAGAMGSVPGGIQQTRGLPGSGPGVQPAGGLVPSVQPAVNHAGGVCADGSCYNRN
jgi:hypothetical protein